MSNITPPENIVRFFKKHGLEVPENWQEASNNQSWYSFLIAKATTLQIINNLKENLEQAETEGKSFSEFKKDIEQTVPFSKQKLKFIFDENITTSLASSWWKKLEANKHSSAQYLQYRIGVAQKHRAEHVAFNGLILPFNSPFWDTHYPPNGFRCKCWVQPLSHDEAKGKVSKEPTLKYTMQKNPRTGKAERKYHDVDLGFANNVGKNKEKPIANNLKYLLKNTYKQQKHNYLKQLERFKDV